MSIGPLKRTDVLLLIIFLFFFLLSFGTHAQQTGTPSVVFTCDFPSSDPAHYEITVLPDGSATYNSQPKAEQTSGSETSAQSSAPDLYTSLFQVSPTTATRILDLAKKANYFMGNVDSGKKKLASTGMKTLAYKSSDRTTSANYNYSENSSIQELTSIFQNLSTTLEFARRLDYDLRFQKTAIDQELKAMEDMESRGSLAELSAAAPILQKIAEDTSIMNISRSRAQRLLAKASTSK